MLEYRHKLHRLTQDIYWSDPIIYSDFSKYFNELRPEIYRDIRLILKRIISNHSIDRLNDCEAYAVLAYIIDNEIEIDADGIHLDDNHLMAALLSHG